MKKTFYSKWFRFLLFFVAFISGIVLTVSVVVTVQKANVFYKDNLSEISSYAETKEVKESLNSDIQTMCNSVLSAKEYSKLDTNKTQIYLTNYTDWSKEKVSVDSYSQYSGKEIMDAARDFYENDIYSDDSGNKYSTYGYYNYGYYDFSDTKQYLRISSAEYWKLVSKYTEANFRTLDYLPDGVTVTDNSAIDGNVYLPYDTVDNTISDNENTISDKENTELYIETNTATDATKSNDYTIQDDSQTKTIYNSLKRSENPKCSVEAYDNSDSVRKQYDVRINVNFGDNCFIFQQGENTFLYSDEENVMYNDIMGWISLDYLYGTEYLYIPMTYLKYDSQEIFEESILLAPQFNSITPVFFAGMDNEYSDALTSAIYNGYEYWVYGKSYAFNYINFADENIVSTNASDDFDADSESFSDCNAAIQENNDVIISYNGEVAQENSYYLDAKGNKIKKNFLSKYTLKQLENLGTSFNCVLGMNIYSNPSTSVYYWDNIIFMICKSFNNTIPFFGLSFIILIVCIVCLSKSAGIKINDAGEKKLSMTFLEKMPYEIVLILGAAIGTGVVFLCGSSLEYRSYNIISSGKSDFDYAFIFLGMILLGLLSFILLEIYLSLVRRIKNHIFIKDLLVVKMVKGLEAYGNRVSQRGKGAKALLMKSVFVFLINIVAIYIAARMIAFESRSGYVVLTIIIVFDVYVIIKIVKYATGVDVILRSTNEIVSGNLDAKVPCEGLAGNCLALADSVNSISDGLNKAIEMSTRDERMKAELITNVSHDIKTPLTSIINYVDLIKRENIDNETIKGYVNVLDQKSQRLKQLTEDLVEASKASTGNIELECMNLNLIELLQQTIGEFEDRFITRKLELVVMMPSDPVYMYADGRRSFRIIENIFQNAYKYAMPGTRVYIDVCVKEELVELTIKNVSEAPLNISPDELTERFVRGDSARTTEGSGLGLSIAKNLTELQGGTFELSIDGDLFRVTVAFPLTKEVAPNKVLEDDKEAEVAATDNKID